MAQARLTPSRRSTGPWRTTATRSRRLATATPCPACLPMPSPMPTMATALMPPTSRKVARQPKAWPMSPPSGRPSAIASVCPALTMASARPRMSGGTITPARPLAAGT